MAPRKHGDEPDNDDDSGPERQMYLRSTPASLADNAISIYAYSTAALDNDAHDGALVEDAHEEAKDENPGGDDTGKTAGGVDSKGDFADVDSKGDFADVDSMTDFDSNPPHIRETHSGTYNFTWDASGSTETNDPWHGTKGDGTEEHNFETSYAGDCGEYNDADEYDDADYADYYDEEDDNDDADFY